MKNIFDFFDVVILMIIFNNVISNFTILYTISNMKTLTPLTKFQKWQKICDNREIDMTNSKNYFINGYHTNR